MCYVEYFAFYLEYLVCHPEYRAFHQEPVAFNSDADASNPESFAFRPEFLALKSELATANPNCNLFPSDDGRHRPRHAVAEVTAHGVAHHLAQFLDGLTLRGNAMPESGVEVAAVHFIQPANTPCQRTRVPLNSTHAAPNPDVHVATLRLNPDVIRMSMSPLQQWNSIDHYTESFPLYNCAFLDILGYKQRALDYFDQRFNLYGRLNRALALVSTTQHLTAPFLNTSGLTIEIISDSIIMMQPAAQGGLGALLSFACHFASALSFEGLFIRGGIAQGRHTRKRTEQGYDFLASEALQKAYILETQQAVNPRVLVDSALIDTLSSEERRLVIRENTDFFVHFAHHVINREGTNVADVHAEMRDLHSAMSRHDDDQIKQKHQWLLDYYYWTIEQNPHWDANPVRHFSSGTDRGFSELG